MDEQILNDQQVENNPEEETSEQAEEEEAQKQAEETSEQEQAEEKDEQAEEILSEEELEIQREIEAYQTKIAELDAKIEEYRSRRITDEKRTLMRKWNYTNEQIERYIDYIDGETVEEIEQSIAKLVEDIAPKGDNFADPSPMNHAKQKPAAADPGEVGKKLFERIKNKIWGGGTTL